MKFLGTTLGTTFLGTTGQPLERRSGTLIGLGDEKGKRTRGTAIPAIAAAVAQLVEHVLGKDGVIGSSPISSSCAARLWDFCCGQRLIFLNEQETNTRTV